MNGKAESKTELRPGRLQPLGAAFVGMLERDQRRLLRLCGTLERVADGLPESLGHARTVRVFSFLNRAYERHIFLHEKCLFPLMRSIAGKAFMEPVLSQLEFEHASDHGLVLEITSAFHNGCSGEGTANVHILGFLLRSFFENFRRHHNWEWNMLFPAAREHLAGDPIAAQHDALLRVSLGLAG